MAEEANGREADVSLTTAYLLALCGGALGLHHLYLDRSFQAILWACTPGLGGFFGIGVLRDLFRMPSYVAARNDLPAEREHLEVEMKYRKVPPWYVSRLLFAYWVCYWFEIVGRGCGLSAFPDGWFHAAGALLAGLGVWLCGNACTNQSGSLKATLLACYVGKLAGDWTALAGVAAFQWTRCWCPEAQKPKLARWKAVAFVLFFWSAALFGLWEHGAISFDAPGGRTTIMFRDCVSNIWRGLNFEDIKEGFESSFSGGGWEGFVQNLDVEGEKRALRTLGMDEFVGKRRAYTEADVAKHYREMAKKWHPDRVPPAERPQAETKMQEVNGAKEVLDRILGKASAGRSPGSAGRARERRSGDAGRGGGGTEDL